MWVKACEVLLAVCWLAMEVALPAVFAANATHAPATKHLRGVCDASGRFQQAAVMKSLPGLPKRGLILLLTLARQVPGTLQGQLCCERAQVAVFAEVTVFELC